MSIWGPKAPENDDAADWVGDLREDLDLGLIEEALEEVADPAHVGFIDVSECCVAVAAAQVWSELLGTPGEHPVVDEEELPPLREQLQEASPKEIRSLTNLALGAVRRILEDRDNSELFDIWEAEGKAMTTWLNEMQDLKSRLQAIAADFDYPGAEGEDEPG